MTDPDDDADLRDFARAVKAFRIAEDELLARLWIARRSGHSWKEIADAAGETQKWVKALRPKDTLQRREPMDL